MEISSAKRTLLQTTLSPLKPEAPKRGPTRRPALEIAAALRSLTPSREEIARAHERVDGRLSKQILSAMEHPDPTVLAATIASLEEGDAASAAVFEALVTERARSVERAVSQLKDWLHRAEVDLARSVTEPLMVEAAAADSEDADRARRLRALLARLAPADREAFLIALRGASGSAAVDRAMTDFEERAPPAPGAIEGAAPRPAAAAALRAELEPQIQRRLSTLGSLGERLQHVLAARGHEAATDKTVQEALQSIGVDSPRDLDSALTYWAELKPASPHVMPFAKSSFTEPIGCLHLERLSFIPAGIEHGALVSSLPLAPGESVALVHKEWANTDEEFTKLVADQFEDYSERGVVDKVEMAEACAAQQQHASAFTVSVSASGGYGPVSATTSSGYSVQSAEAAARMSSIRSSQDVTQKASSRTRREHRMTFRLAKKTQVGDETVRLIKNPDPFHPVRYDFYQLMRKWRVNLHRYGVRLTYDLTIPEPASDLMEIYRELASLESLLEEGFVFDVPPAGLTRHSWKHYANRYGADIEPPPPLCVSVQAMKMSGPFAGDERKLEHLDELHIAAPDGYIFKCHDVRSFSCVQPGDTVFWPDPLVMDKHPAPGVTTDIGYAIQSEGITGSLSSVRAWFVLREDHERAWHVKAYNALRDAAHKAYLEKRATLEQRRARLLSELGSTPALTLRKLEREELMKGVLRWLFGPGFRFAPGSASGQDSPFDASGAVKAAAWLATLQQEKLVTFLHQAVEWENINYFLYPYFWTPIATWRRRLRLRHEDPIHEAFLRAGAARVVLPIRPGWERAFLSVLATGTQDGLDGVKIGEAAPSEGAYSAAGFAPENPWAKAAPLLDAVTELVKSAAKRILPKE